LSNQLENRWPRNVETNELLVKPKAVDFSVFLVLTDFDTIYESDRFPRLSGWSFGITEKARSRVNVQSGDLHLSMKVARVSKDPAVPLKAVDLDFPFDVRP